jgi:MFS family permease
MSKKAGMQVTRTWRLTVRVFLPFAAGYYLSYLFRTINALIVSDLSSDAGLGSANLGLLTSVYFLVFAAAQIPVGILLDRFGPRRVQSALLWFAALGAGLFAVSTGFLSFLIARAMIGLGVAGALTAGLKSIILWFPRERVALVNGYMIMLGSLGAVTATVPVEHLLAWMGWRQLFEILAAATGATAILIYVVVPEQRIIPSNAPASATLGFRFQRQALLADSTVVGDLRWFSLVAAGIVGITVACSRGGARSRRPRQTAVHHVDRTQRRCLVVRYDDPSRQTNRPHG